MSGPDPGDRLDQKYIQYGEHYDIQQGETVPALEEVLDSHLGTPQNHNGSLKQKEVQTGIFVTLLQVMDPKQNKKGTFSGE